jgi:hypothetical protein
MLGTFLRSFTFGHVRQLDRLTEQLLGRAWAAGAGPGDGPMTLVVAKTLRQTLLALPGRITRSARRLVLHLPVDWPWAAWFELALARLRWAPTPPDHHYRTAQAPTPDRPAPACRGGPTSGPRFPDRLKAAAAPARPCFRTPTTASNPPRKRSNRPAIRASVDPGSA